jgi:hypothetical protein
VDEGNSERPKVVAWSKKMHPGFPVLHDPESKAAEQLGMTGGIPYNLVLDRSGRVVGSASDVEELDKLVAKVVPTTRLAPHRRASR